MHIDPRRLPVLLAVHREGGIVAAADILGISPSAVSQQIQRLEDEVGLTLIERAPTGAVLTPAGHVLAESAERIDSELTEAARLLRPLTGQVTGSVVIGSFPTLITGLIVPFLPDLAHDLPGIDLHLVEVEEGPGMSALRAGTLDLLALERDESSASTPRGYTDTPVLDEPWVLITPAHTRPVATEEDLAELTWLRVPPNTAGANAMRRITARVSHPEWTSHTYTNYTPGLAMVAAGLGSTVMPSLAVADAAAVPDGVRISPLPGLGARRLLLRHRTSLVTPDSPTARVLDHLLRWAAANRSTITESTHG